MFNECVNQLCEEGGQFLTCRDVKMELSCVELDVCSPGCICINGTVRNENGECVPIDQCNTCYLDDGSTLAPGATMPGDLPCEIW